MCTAPLLHAEWHGCTPTDLVFPFFLFIVGVSIALGIVPRMEAGADAAALRRAVLLRAAKIIGLGLVLHAAGVVVAGQALVPALGRAAADRPVFRGGGLLALATRRACAVAADRGPAAGLLGVAGRGRFVCAVGQPGQSRRYRDAGAAGLPVRSGHRPGPRSGRLAEHAARHRDHACWACVRATGCGVGKRVGLLAAACCAGAGTGCGRRCSR